MRRRSGCFYTVLLQPQVGTFRTESDHQEGSASLSIGQRSEGVQRGGQRREEGEAGGRRSQLRGADREAEHSVCRGGRQVVEDALPSCSHQPSSLPLSGGQ